MAAAAEHMIGRGRSVLGQFLQLVETRLELLALEFQEERLAIVRELRLVALAVATGWLAAFALILWIGLSAGEVSRNVLLGGIVAVLTASSLTTFLVIRRSRQRAPLLDRLIEQIRLDRISLSGSAHAP